MTNPQLIDYITKAKQAGQSDEQIKSSLFSTGWPEDAINESFQSPLPNKRISKFFSIILWTVIIIFAMIVIGYVIFKLYLELDLRQKLEEERVLPTQEKSGEVIFEKDILGYHIKAPNELPLENIFKKASEKAGFHIYYPTYTPNGIEVNRDFTFIVDDPSLGTKAMVDVGEVSSENPSVQWIAIIEEKIEPDGKSDLLEKSFDNKQNITINNQKGFYGLKTTDNNNFYHLIFATEDGTALWLWSKDFNIETLVKIAESMK